MLLSPHCLWCWILLALTGVPNIGNTQDFIGTMTAVDKSQWITIPAHVAGHTLFLVFSARYMDADLDVMDSWLYTLLSSICCNHQHCIFEMCCCVLHQCLRRVEL